MTTLLLNALKREIYIGGHPYRVTLTTEGITVVRKGGQKGVAYSWEEFLANREAAMESRDSEAPTPTPLLSRAVLTELATTVRAAAAAMASADEKLTQAGALPQRLVEATAQDPLSGNARQDEHWFIEPLLTLAEVAAILRVSTRTVRRLPIGTVPIRGEVRYLQSAVREYLRRTAVAPPSTRSWR
jgi:hypothetical protein